MIRNIVFGGCSYTWGQSLHFYGNFNDDEHPKDGCYYSNKLLPHHYQYNVDHRFATIVSDFFGRKPIVCATNGNNNELIVKFIEKSINEYTDLVIFQSTAWTRCYEWLGGKNGGIKNQVILMDNLIDFCESKNILIRFIHLDVDSCILGVDDTFKEGENLLTQKIIDRTILIDERKSFYHLTERNIVGERPKYTVWGDYEYQPPDKHFNKLGHEYIANILIKHLEKIIKKPEY